MKISRIALICASPALALVASVADAADFYKCKDAHGRTSYQDVPCQSGTAEQLDIKPQAKAQQQRGISSYGQTDAEIAAQRDIQAAKQLERERDANRSRGDWDRRMNQIDRESNERMERWRRSYSR